MADRDQFEEEEVANGKTRKKKRPTPKPYTAAYIKLLSVRPKTC
jgi:hypothetical protein